ncbi:hypothetical protein [Krasilnikovia sp. M28-CT-15]|uniref:hypothetical protein n=1 Tax=Krasilnikovia sp. M28-CT-15 TaxID=3373540 RepID=UPI003876E3DE
MRIKLWLRGPADDPQVEIVAEFDGRAPGRPAARAGRSILTEALPHDGTSRRPVADGWWFLPG